MAEDDSEPRVLHVAQHQQRHEDHTGRHDGWEQATVLGGLHKGHSRSPKKKKGGAFSRWSTRRTHPAQQRGGAAASQVHDVEDDEAADAGEHFVCSSSRKTKGKPSKHFKTEENTPVWREALTSTLPPGGWVQ